MGLIAMPPIERLTLATVTTVPEWHPHHAVFQPFPVHAWIVRHPDGVLLVDSGIGLDNPVINEWYQPRVVGLADALESLHLGIDDVAAVVLSHLHFDHCGQMRSLDAPVYVQAVEQEAAKTSGYTIPEWADIPLGRLQLVTGDEEILEGVRLVSTPGHTPGHQSVDINMGTGRTVLVAQCAYRAAELFSGRPDSTNLHDDTWEEAARDSLRRIRALAPFTAQFSHDPEVAQFR